MPQISLLSIHERFASKDFDDTPEMNEKEPSRKEGLVLSIEARIRRLVYQVQDEELHDSFVPGCAWWLASLGEHAKTKFPGVVHLCDQIGVSQVDFKEAFGRLWLMSKKFPFSDLRSRKLGGFNFVTIAPMNPYSDYGTETMSPNDSSLIVSSALESSWVKPSKLLLHSIEELLVTPISIYQQEQKQQEPENTAAQLVTPASMPLPSVASDRTESPRRGKQTPATSSDDPLLQFVATNPASPDVATGAVTEREVDGGLVSLVAADIYQGNEDVLESSAHSRAVAAALAVPVPRREIDRRLASILAQSQALRAELDRYKGDKAIEKMCCHIAYEHVTMMQKVSGKKDSVSLRPSNAGGSTWTREVSSRGGQSARTQRKDMLAIKKKINVVTKGKETWRQAIVDGGIPLFGFTQKTKQVVNLSEDEYLNLLEAGGMTDRKMLAFGRLLSKLY
jgi:hypothetical protein